MEKKDLSKYKEFDFVDCVKDEEHAMWQIRKSAEQDDWTSTPDWVDDIWEDINQASARHGFPITPAMQDAYAEARASAEAVAHITIPIRAAAIARTRVEFSISTLAEARAEVRAAKKAARDARKAARPAVAEARRAERKPKRNVVHLTPRPAIA